MDKKVTRYENWKDLEPISKHVKEGTKCVCLVDYGSFTAGDVVVLGDDPKCIDCFDEYGNVNMMSLEELALLPAEASASPTPSYPEKKQEHKIVHTSCAWVFTEASEHVNTYISGALETIATCDDGTVWHYSSAYSKWTQLPPIPQDDE